VRPPCWDSLVLSVVSYFSTQQSHNVLNLLSGLTTFAVNRVRLGKAVNSFNSQIQQMGPGAPQIQANLGNGFNSKSIQCYSTPLLTLSSLVIWASYALGVVPLVCMLMNVYYSSMAGKAGKAEVSISITGKNTKIGVTV
jgi:hypothetical protein